MENNYKFCPNCGFKNPVEARFCQECGANFDEFKQDDDKVIDIDSTNPDNNVNSQFNENNNQDSFVNSNRCQNCGEPLTENDPYCPKCFTPNPNYGVNNSNNESYNVQEPNSQYGQEVLVGRRTANEYAPLIMMASSLLFCIVFSFVAPIEVISLALNYRSILRLFKDDKTKKVRYLILNSVCLFICLIFSIYIIIVACTTDFSAYLAE